MKLSLCLAVAAAAVAPPKISVSLDGAYKLAKPIVRQHDQKLTQPDGSKVMSRQDYTERCQAGKDTSVTCPSPEAKAYDHKDKAVKVVTRLFLVDEQGVGMNKEIKDLTVDYSKRSTYLFKYDAKDAAGNHAEQVVFGLILDDKIKPVITMCAGSSETVEAASSWKLCANSVATDNIDGTISDKIQYTVKYNGVAQLTKGSYADAAAKITTYKVGNFEVRMDVADTAGVYGHDSINNNAVTQVKGIKVQDTRKPWIIADGAMPVVQECSKTYTDAGAVASDLLDSANGDALKISTVNPVDSATVGSYSVTYDVTDKNKNVADTVTRVVNVVDTVKPTVTLKGQDKIVHYSADQFNDPGATTADSCDKKLPAYDMGWNRNFNDRVLGDYVRTYSVSDASGNANSAQRTFTVVDNKVPILKVVGKDEETLEATRDIEYTDKGATCHDYVDGVLSHAVEVSGQVVNMRIPGTYTIRYDCQDLSGNEATKMNRKVVVRDTTCPTVSLNGASLNYVEAGFPYVDAGATATDSLDGDITKKIFTDGDTVNTAQVFYSRQSCREIKAYYAGATSGEYYITTYANSKAINRVLVWCDFVGTAKKTFFPCKSCARVSPYKTEQGDCTKMGLKMAQGPFSTFIKTKYGAKFFPQSGTTNDYLCTTDETKAEHREHVEANAKVALNRAEAGKYVVQYHVSDLAGNNECKTLMRTVIVKDSLPPVITLHMNKKLVATKAANANTGHKDTKTYSNIFAKDFLMAETQTSVNGWLVGAVASAVAGVALLGLSARKNTVTIDV